MDQFCYLRQFTAVKFAIRKRTGHEVHVDPPPMWNFLHTTLLTHWTLSWRVDFWKMYSSLVCETPCVPSVTSATCNCSGCSSRNCLKWWYSCCHRLVTPAFEAVWDAVKDHTYWLVFVTGRTGCLLRDRKTHT